MQTIQVNLVLWTPCHGKNVSGLALLSLSIVATLSFLNPCLPAFNSSDLGPEERVEMSLLRQCLENAMATELSPHERDVLRLRHGLDDGVSRSIKEVCDMLGTVSISDVRKSENSAFRKLRSPYSVHTYHLLGFLDYVGVDQQNKAQRPSK